MKVIIVHPFINQRGGAEKVCVRMIDALHKAGHDVTLYTIEKTNWTPIEADWGIEHRPHEFWYLKDQRYLRLPLIRWPIFLILYLTLLIKAAKMRDHVSLNNFGEIFPLFTDVCYIHSLPLSESINENPYDIPLWGTIRPIYMAFLNILSDHVSGTILTNSKYNEERISKHSHSRIMILYPPVDVGEAPHAKTSSILNASRLSKSKKLETIPKIAAHVTTPCEFNLCITTRDANRANITRLKAPNIIITQNPSKQHLRQLYQSSKIYLSTQPTEAIGLSIVEAMGAGCIPLVPRDGGPWRDILEEKQGEVGYSFTSLKEAAQRIDEILGDEAHAERLRKAAINRAKHFQSDKFQTSLPLIIEEIYTRKSRDV